jgi:hypothetical protein
LSGRSSGRRGQNFLGDIVANGPPTWPPLREPAVLRSSNVVLPI